MARAKLQVGKNKCRAQAYQSMAAMPLPPSAGPSASAEATANVQIGRPDFASQGIGALEAGQEAARRNAAAFEAGQAATQRQEIMDQRQEAANAAYVACMNA